MNNITIGLHGFSDRSANILKLFLARHFKAMRALVNTDGLLNIIDLDSINARQIWDSYSGIKKEVPLIVVSIHEKKLSNTVWLKKPIDVERLMLVIEQLYSNYKKHSSNLAEDDKLRRIADLEDIDTKDFKCVEKVLIAVRNDVCKELNNEEIKKTEADISKQRVYVSKSLQGYSLDVASCSLEKNTVHSSDERRALQAYYGSRDDSLYIDDLKSSDHFYEARDFLQGSYTDALELSRKEDKIIHLKSSGVSLYINYKENRVYTNCRESLLRNVSFIKNTGADSFTVVPLNNYEHFESKRQQFSVYTLKRLLWSLSLWSSRGRLPVGVSGDAVVTLNRWPNFTRLDITPYAMQIVALWFNKPTSVNQTAIQLNVPYRAVYSVFSACYAHGLIVGLSSDEAQIVKETINIKQKVSLPKQLFRAIFNKLG